MLVSPALKLPVFSHPVVAVPVLKLPALKSAPVLARSRYAGPGVEAARFPMPKLWSRN